MHDVERLIGLLKDEGFDTEAIEFKRALRRFENPSGCEHCGARTKVANVGRRGMTLACCKKPVETV